MRLTYIENLRVTIPLIETLAYNSGIWLFQPYIAFIRKPFVSVSCRAVLNTRASQA